MKKLIYLFASATFIVLAIVACNNGKGNDPKETAMAFIEAMKNKDYDGAAKYSTKDTKTFLDIIKIAASKSGMGNKKDEVDFSNMFNLKNATYSDAKIDGDSIASVGLTADGKEQLPIILKKEDGAWKVAFDINTIMQQATEKMNQDHINVDTNMNKIPDTTNIVH